MTMVNGSVVARDGRLLTADMDALIAEAQAVVPGLFARRAAWLADHQQGAVSPV
jgi:5-methylthioadenosine/S-adenosylhomocysteine deaminase